MTVLAWQFETGYRKLQLIGQLSQITEIEDAQPVCSLSAGFTGIRATDTKAEPILHRADSALYDAKAAGRATIRAYREGSPAA